MIINEDTEHFIEEDITKLILHAYIEESVNYKGALDRSIEIEEFFMKNLTAEQFKLFREYAEESAGLHYDDLKRLIKYVLKLCKVLF